MLTLTLMDIARAARKGTKIPDIASHYLYAYGEDDVTFYVGQSINPVSRLAQHLGDEPRSPFPDAIGLLIIDNQPRSLIWHVLLYTLSDCQEIVQRQSLGSLPFYESHLNELQDRKYVMTIAEEALISELKPCLNVLGNQDPTPLPARYRKVHTGLVLPE